MSMPLLIYSLSSYGWLYDFDLILGFNSGAVPRMGLRSVAPTPFGSCLFFLVIYLFVVPNKAV